METKELFKIGNLFKGNTVYAVEAVSFFDSSEIHGPFKSENDANNYAHELAASFAGYGRIDIVTVELALSPDSKRIVHDSDSPHGYSYREEA